MKSEIRYNPLIGKIHSASVNDSLVVDKSFVTCDDILSAIKWYKKYANNLKKFNYDYPAYGFELNELASSVKYTATVSELFNDWLLNKAFEDIINLYKI